MQVKVTITKQAKDRARALGLSKQLNRKIGYFINNPSHPSLHFELLQPKQLGIYSIRINDQFRAKLVKAASDEYTIFEVVDYH